MSTRVTDRYTYKRSQEALSRNRDKMLKSQEESMTGLKINKPSQDPVGSMRMTNLHSEINRAERINSNMDIATGYVNLAESAMNELTEVLTRAKELAIQMSSTTNASEDGMLSASKEVDQLFLRIVQIGNSKFGDRFVFGGYQTDRPPFDIQGNYWGDDESLELEVDRGQKATLGIPGNYAFLGLKELPKNPRDSKGNMDPTYSTAFRQPASEKLDDKGEVVSAEKATEQRQELEQRKLGGVNLFRSLKSFSDALKTMDRTNVNRAIDDMDQAFAQVLQTRTLLGARQNVLKMAQGALDGSTVNGKEELSRVRDSDSIAAFSELTRSEQALNASLEVSKRLVTPSLLDFLK